MGFDLVGSCPKSEVGEYFRANIWHWPPIHSLIATTEVLDSEALDAITYNDGYLISEEAAIAIASALEVIMDDLPEEYSIRVFQPELIEESVVMDEGREVITYRPNYESEPKETRVGDDGRLLRDDEEGGKSPYTISKEYLNAFIAFCRYSGGFAVW